MENTFDDFLEGFSDWLDTPEGEAAMQAIDDVNEALEGADVDLKEKKIIWADGKKLTIDESAERIHSETGTDLKAIKNHIICWLSMEFVPDGFNEKQMEDFEIEIYEWIKEYKQMHKKL